MWRPPQRIKWQPDPGEWPTRAEAAASRLFSPVALGPATLEQRTWIPAMVPWRATGDGMVTPEVLDWYGRFARGRPGAIVVEATGIRDIPPGPLMRIGDDRFIPGLHDLADTVRRESGGHTRLLIQLIDSRGESDIEAAKREELAKQMYHSTREKLMKLPDHVLVYPAHGSGSLCGKALSDANRVRLLMALRNRELCVCRLIGLPLP